MASSLNHPHILTVHDKGEFGGRQYLVTEFVDGGTLKDWAKAEKRTWRETVELLTDAMNSFVDHCVVGIELNRETIDRYRGIVVRGDGDDAVVGRDAVVDQNAAAGLDSDADAGGGHGDGIAQARADGHGSLPLFSCR